jgi:hypothetical protein
VRPPALGGIRFVTGGFSGSLGDPVRAVRVGHKPLSLGQLVSAAASHLCRLNAQAQGALDCIPYGNRVSPCVVDVHSVPSAHLIPDPLFSARGLEVLISTTPGIA